MDSSTAVLVISHGAPDTLEELPAFLSNIRRGRPAPESLLAEVRHKYAAIGGRSPLKDRTKAQAEALGALLGMRAYWCQRMWNPYPNEVLEQMASEGIRRVVCVPAAPYSVHVYHDVVARAVRAMKTPVELLSVPVWNTHEGLVRAFSEDLLRRYALLQNENVQVLCTAHSLPVKVLATDPYQTLVEETMRKVIAQLPEGARTRMVYQSQGATDDEWLGPDLLRALDECKQARFSAVLLCPVGFVSDHVEVQYDLDHEARAKCASLGLRYERSETPNMHEGLLGAMAWAVRAALS